MPTFFASRFLAAQPVRPGSGSSAPLMMPRFRPTLRQPMTEPTRESRASFDSVQDLWADWTFDRESSQTPRDPLPEGAERPDDWDLVEGYQRFALVGDAQPSADLSARLPRESR